MVQLFIKNKLNRLTPSKIKQLAIGKMKDVSLISVEFKDAPVVFEPYLKLIHDFGEREEFLGVYLSGYSDDKFENICVRRCTWEKNDKSFENGFIKNTFYRFGALEALLSICSSITSHLEKGINLIPSKCIYEQHQYLNISFSGENFRYEIEYSPNVKCDKKLEAFVSDMFLCFDKIDIDSDVPTKNTHRVSYNEGVIN